MRCSNINPRSKLLFALLFSCAIPALTSGAVFDANFNVQPLGPLATQLNTDPAPLQLPTSIIRDAGCTVNVVSTAGNLTDKPVIVDSTPGHLASAAFYNPIQYFSGSYRVSWDSLVMDSPVPDQPDGDDQNVTIVSSLSGNWVRTWALKYLPDGHFRIIDNAGTSEAGSFTIGIATHFDLLLNLGNGHYDLSANGASIRTGSIVYKQFFSSVFESIGRFQTMELPRIAFDNFTVVPVPEPGAIWILAFGMSLTIKRPRRP